MNSSHILNSQVSLCPKFHFYSTYPYFKGLAQRQVLNRHLIHTQLTGHLSLTWEHTFSTPPWGMGTGAYRVGSQLTGASSVQGCW